MTINEKIYREIAQEQGVPLEIVEEVIRFMFKATKDTLEKGEFQGVHLQYLGTWLVKPGRLFKLQQKGIKLSPMALAIVEENNKKYETKSRI